MSDFNFVDYDPLEIRKNYEQAYSEIVGGVITKGDPMSDFLDYITFITSLIYSKIDYTGKMNLLRFAEAEYLDALGEVVGEVREPAQKALTTIKYKFSKAFQSVFIIPKGHKTSASGIYFETISAAQLPIGATEIDIKCECSTAGEIGNGFNVGEITTIVDPLSYLQNVSNITATQGGAEEEEDETFKEKIRTNPTARSVAGPASSYVYHTKKSHQDVTDVHVVSEKGSGIVKVYPLLKDGVIPGDDILGTIKQNLENKEIKPLTDQVETLAPEVVEYDIGIKYFIIDDTTTDEENLKTTIEKSIDDYISWQHSILGRDISPDNLIRLVMNAGAKRVEITSPNYTILQKTQVAKLRNKNLIYGGKEIE
ncbi:MAG: baseplate J/gp47 family protein [Cetobacterium sp.]|uniref:baseplate J/gp47 family protein n=1 Tax=Cetobacterium sp. TaxID=2071632 RepID=UPI003F2A0BBC